MHLASTDYVLWGTATLLELLVCTLAFKHGLSRRLPVFTGYLVVVAARSIGLWWVYHDLGYQSGTTFYFFWVTQGILLFARGLAIAEVCWTALRPYRGIWALGWRLLAGLALLLVFNAALTTRHDAAWIAPFVLTAERGLELAAVGILVLLLAICRYYEMRLEALLTMVALGLGLYSAVQVVNNSLPREWLTHYFRWWEGVRMVSFDAALVIWCLALRKPLPAARPEPVLLEQRVYDELAPQVSYRLRELNDRLLEMLK